MLVRDGLARLGVKRLLLAIHDTSFPSDPDEDIGRGSSATRAAFRLFAYAKGLGFTGIQLGPQGQTSRANPSPYDGTIFSRHLGNISVHSLDVACEPLARSGRPGAPPRTPTTRCTRWSPRRTTGSRRRSAPSSPRFAARTRAGSTATRCTPRCATTTAARASATGPSATAIRAPRAPAGHERAIERYAFGQMLVHAEHARVRASCGLLLYGDLQVGYSDADAWAYQHAFLRGYLMGAPPSRTNPEGQPWGYPVLDPDNPAGRALVVARADKAFAEYDSLRIDHPHGLVCPWVYPEDRLSPWRHAPARVAGPAAALRLSSARTSSIARSRATPTAGSARSSPTRSIATRCTSTRSSARPARTAATSAISAARCSRPCRRRSRRCSSATASAAGASRRRPTSTTRATSTAPRTSRARTG